MTGGSQQLRRFRIAIRDGVDIETAAEQNGMTMGEARSWVADDLKNPPPPGAYVLLGHNSGTTEMSDVIAADQLRIFIERVERLEEEKKGLSDDIRDIYAEAKSNGYDVRTVRECVKLRRLEKHVRDEREMLLETYKAALGMDYSDTPLGAAAVERAVYRGSTAQEAMRRTVDAVNAGALGPNVTAKMN